MEFYDMINFGDRFQVVWKESSCHQGESLTITDSFQEKNLSGNDAVTLKML